MNTEQERERFEAWAKERRRDVSRFITDFGPYANVTTDEAWLAWQARAAEAANPMYNGMPEAAWLLLAAIHADADYLFGRVAIDGSVACAMADSVRKKIDAIKAIYHPPAVKQDLTTEPAAKVPFDFDNARVVSSQEVVQRETDRQFAWGDNAPATDKDCLTVGAGEHGCECQGCGLHYRYDLLVPDHVWERIKPSGKEVGAGLLCAHCIMRRITDGGIWTAARAFDVDAPPERASNSYTLPEGDAPKAVLWQRREIGTENWWNCSQESYEHSRRTGNAGVFGYLYEVRALYAAPPADAPIPMVGVVAPEDLADHVVTFFQQVCRKTDDRLRKDLVVMFGAMKSLHTVTSGPAVNSDGYPSKFTGKEQSAQAYIRDWCPDHVRDYIESLKTTTDARDAEDAGRYQRISHALSAGDAELFDTRLIANDRVHDLDIDAFADGLQPADRAMGAKDGQS